jgi:uroporphyrinogen-III synthase
VTSPVVVLRPEPGNAATCAAARSMGLEPLAAPLFAIEPLAWTAPEGGRFDAVLFGSANALRHGGPDLARYAALPAYAVGAATAEAARSAGFAVAAVGDDGIEGLLGPLFEAGHRRVLRVAGEVHVPVAPPVGCVIETVAVYRARPTALSDAAAEALGRGALALLHSAEAARRFAQECDRRGLDRGRIALACLGPRVAAAAGSGWSAVAAAATPTDAALLALAARMCQTGVRGVAQQT